MILKSFCTTRQAASLLGVSLRTTQLWVESGLLEAWKTAGGHRRITRESIDRLLYKTESIAPNVEYSNIQTHLKILVVEDDLILNRLYLQVITNWPMRPEVIFAKNGVEALVKIGREQPDFLITDLLMPHMDGFAMLRILRAMPEAQDMTIVTVSGLDLNEIEEKGGVPDGIKIFPKPVPFKELLNIAQLIVKNRSVPGEDHAK